MSPERWSRIKEIFHAALERNEAERAAFLDEACGADADLRQQVERLLREHRDPTKLKSPVAERDLSGRTLSHYRILDKIGEGGMGVVYKAEDARLHRAVALKFLRPEALGSEEVKTRFLHEAEAAAALEHPNICTVHEIDEAEGQTFLAMAYVDGESLAEKIRKRPLPLEGALRIAIQVAEGLHAAHQKGIVHRDIKSGNVLIDSEGWAKIMDFGLAHLTGGTRITQSGVVLGTPGYMSPEQVRGEEADHRTDIWSLGVVLYEMVTGRLPFSGETAQSVALAIQNEEPEPLTALRSGVPLELERIVNKALAKRPEARYQHADEILVDLRGVGLEPVPARVRRRKLAYAAALVALVVALVVAGIVFWRRTETPSIAVMPFVNLSADEEAEYLIDGMTDELIMALGRVEGLRVIGRDSVFRWKGKNCDPRQVGAQLKVGTVLVGGVRKEGERLRVTARLINVANGFELWSQRFGRESQDLFDVQDRLARAVLETLKPQPAADVPARSVERPRNLLAYKLLLEAQYYSEKGSSDGFTKAKQCFEQAILADPGYAQPYAALAINHAFQVENYGAPANEVMPEAKAQALKALEINDRVADGHLALAYVRHLYEWDWPGAEREYRRAIALDPANRGARTLYGWFLSHMGRHREAIAEAKRCLELDPVSLQANRGLAQAHLYARQYDEALLQCRRAVELDPYFMPGHSMLWEIYAA